MNVNKFILIILDGWGIGNHSRSDCISSAPTPNLDKLKEKYPNSQLLASGEYVGLPDGQMGNSEVGHLNIGAGRIVYQDLVRINKAIRDNSIASNPAIVEAFNYAKNNNKKVHFIGLLSNGGVHSMNTHLYKLCDIAKDFGLEKVFIHALMDGRDCDPHSGLGFMEELQEHLKKSTGRVASVCGRYFTMDRDKRWERVKQGYDLMVHGNGRKFIDPLQAINTSYNEGVSDEFIKPCVIVNPNNEPIASIQENDVVICFNFRTDRLREITIALTQQNFPEFSMNTLHLHYLTMANYDDSFSNIKVIYDKDNVINTIGEIISANHLKQLRIAETEKYPHVTFFFSGGREDVFPGEDRIMIPSPKVATYDLQPEMSAYLVKDAVVKELRHKKYDFICLNFANGDMVGHSGVYSAIYSAVQHIDNCVGEVIKSALRNGYQSLIIADHGNADNTINDDGTANTAHSLNPVPCILVSDKYQSIKSGVLADVAPTILTVMGLDVPEEMTGKILV
ncbi:MAG: 2,3-bisphosphoglycerate-independent phosphoglycerate mutase [Bacteroidota bacterium]